MEKGMVGDRPAGQTNAAPAAASPPTTVERGAEGTDATPMETPTEQPLGGLGGGPIEDLPWVPREPPDPYMEIVKEEDGTWRLYQEGDGSWRWDEDAHTWRGEGYTNDRTDIGGPESPPGPLPSEPNRPR